MHVCMYVYMDLYAAMVGFKTFLFVYLDWSMEKELGLGACFVYTLGSSAPSRQS